MSIQSEIDRLISVRNELRVALQNKGATLTDGAVLADFVGAVNNLSIGSDIDFTGVTVTAGSMLKDVVAIGADGTKVTGSIPTVKATLSGDTVTVPAGYIATKQTFTVNAPELPNTTVTAADLRSGVTAINENGEVVTGTMPNGSIQTPTVTFNNDEITFEVTVKGSKGYYDSAISKKFTLDATTAMESAVPELSLNYLGISGGEGDEAYVVLDMSTYTPGYLKSDWTMEETVTVPAVPHTVYIPGTEDQSISSDQWINGSQVIKGDSNLVAGNIKKGVTIFNVTGSFEAAAQELPEVSITADKLLTGYTALDSDGNIVNGSMPYSQQIGHEGGGFIVEYTAGYLPEGMRETAPTAKISETDTTIMVGRGWVDQDKTFNKVVSGESADIQFGVVDENGNFQPLNGENAPPTAVGNPITGEFYTFDTDRQQESSGVSGGGSGSFVKVTNFIAPHRAFTAVTSINVTGFGEAYNDMDGYSEDFSRYNGIYVVTTDTARETEITKRVFKHPIEEMYIFFAQETEYGEGDCWCFDSTVDSSFSAYEALAFMTGDTLPNGTANWSKVYYDMPALTTTHTTTNIPEQELVLEGAPASWDPERRRFVVSTGTAINLTAYTVTPEKGNIYAYSDSMLHGHPVAFYAAPAIPSNFTSDESLPGYVIDFSAADGDYDEAYRIFNMNFTEENYAWYDSSISEANPGWVSIEVPGAFAPSRIFIMNEIASPENLKNAQFQGYNTDGTWDTLVTITNSPNKTGLQQNFDIDTNKAYKKFRLLITAAHSSGVSIQAFMIYRKEYEEA